MAFPPNATRLAIFKVLNGLGLEVGDSDRASLLEAAWASTGLRNSDLMEGLAQLDREHFLRLHSIQGELAVRYDCPLPLLSRLSLTDRLALRRARKRLRFGPHSFERRGRENPIPA